MGVFQQVWLLLWKNAKLKIRSPVLTGATLFWPILMFVIVALIRMRLPPDHHDECHFRPQAMPSVGTVDFMQSMMCDLSTECKPESQVPRSDELPTFGASVGLLLENLDPLFSNQSGSSLVEDFESLPLALGPLINLTKTLEVTFNEISEQNFSIKSFFKNETLIRQDLLAVFSEALVNPILDARINILELLDVIGYSDTGSIFCNATLLQRYVVFPHDADIDEITTMLCGLQREEITDVVNIVLEELDVQYIANEVTSFLRAVDRYGLDNFTRDVEAIQEQLGNIDGLGAFVDILPQLLQLTRLIPDITRFIEVIQDRDIDQMLYLLNGIIDSIDWTGSPQWWDDVRDILHMGVDLVSKLYGMISDGQYQEIPVQDIVLNGTILKDVLAEFNFDKDVITGLLNSTLDLDMIMGFLQILQEPERAIRDYCAGEISIGDYVSLGGAVNESMLRSVVCSGNGTSILDAIRGEIDLAALLKQHLQSFPGLSNATFDLGPIINQTLALIQAGENLPDFIKNLPSMLQGFNNVELGPLLDVVKILLNGSDPTSALVDLTIQVSTLFEGLFTQTAWWPEVQRQLSYQLVFLDAEIAFFEGVLDGALLDAIKADPFTRVGELLLVLGPNITEAVLSTFLNPLKIEELLALPTEQQALVFCSDFIDYPPGLEVTYVQQELCKLSLDDLYPSHVAVWAEHFPEVVAAIEKLEVLGSHNISAIPPSYFENATFANVIRRYSMVQEMIGTVQMKFEQLDVDELLAALGGGEVTGSPEEWAAMLGRLQTTSLPAFSASFLAGEWEALMDYIVDIPDVQNYLAALVIQDALIQDINDLLNIYISVSFGVVPPLGGELETFLEGIVFLTEQGHVIQAAIEGAYQDPSKAILLINISDYSQLLCNPTLRDSLLDLPSVNLTVLDETLCVVDYDMLGYEFLDLMRNDTIYYHVSYLFVPSHDRSQPIQFNTTEQAIHINQLMTTIQYLDVAQQNWGQIVAFYFKEFTPPEWLSMWNMMIDVVDGGDVTEDLSIRNITLMIEQVINMTWPEGMSYIHQQAALQQALFNIVYSSNVAFDILDGLSRGEIVSYAGPEVSKLLEALLGVDHLNLYIALSDQEVLVVLSQVTDVWAVFCNATLRDDILNLPGRGIDTSLFDRTICTFDGYKALEEVIELFRVNVIEFWLGEFLNMAANTDLKLSDIYWDEYLSLTSDLVANVWNTSQVLDHLGDQFQVPQILAYLQDQWLGQYLGTPHGNYSDWGTMFREQLDMVWVQLDAQLGDIPGWDQYKASVYVVLASIEHLVSGDIADLPPLTLASLVPNATEFAALLSQATDIEVGIIQQLLNAPIDPMTMIEIFSSGRWNESLCDPAIVELIFIEPEGLNLTQLQGALCMIDFEALVTELSQGSGIDHIVSIIIEQIIVFSGGDDFGIGDFPITEWTSRFEQLLQAGNMQDIQMFIQSLTGEVLLVLEEIDGQLVNVTGWGEFKSNLGIVTTILQYTSAFLGNGTSGLEPISLATLVPDAADLVVVLSQTTSLDEATIWTLITTPIDPSVLTELVISHSWNATLCSKEGLGALFLDTELFNLTELQGALCNLDFQNGFTDLMQGNGLQDVLNLINNQLLQSILPLFTLPGLSLGELLPQLSALTEMINLQNLQSLEDISSLFVNETWYQEVVRQLMFQDFLTKMLTDKLILLEGQEIVFPYLGNLLTDSSELQRILLEDYALGPGMVEAILTLSLSPDKMLAFFNMSSPLLTLCATGQFSSFFYSPLNPDFDVVGLERAICNISIDQLLVEVKGLVSYDEAMEKTIEIWTSNPGGQYNWTASYLTSQRWAEVFAQFIENPPTLSFDEVWVNKTLGGLMEIADRWGQAQERLGMSNLEDIGSSFESLSMLLETGIMANQTWALELNTALKTLGGVLGYTNSRLWSLPGRNISLQDLLPAYIADQIEANSDLAPDVIALLLHASVNTDKLLAGNRTWLESVCLDATTLPLLVQLPHDINITAAQAALCSLDVSAWEMAYLQEIGEIMIAIENEETVNFTVMAANVQGMIGGIQALIDTPPNLAKYNEAWFIQTWARIEAILNANVNNSMSIFTDPGRLTFILNEAMGQLAGLDPAIQAQFRINDYATAVLIDLLQMFPGQTYTLPKLEELFSDTVYVRQLLAHSDIAPEIIDVFMSLAVDSSKLALLFNSTTPFVTLCQSGQFSTFFTLPPDSPTDISLVEGAICSTNLTLVLAELDQKFKVTTIITEFQRLLSNDPTLPPFNQTAAMLRQEELAAIIEALIQAPPTFGVDPAWWADFSTRSEAILNQWVERLTAETLTVGNIPSLEESLALLKDLGIPGVSQELIDLLVLQSQLISSGVLDLLVPMNGTDGALPSIGAFFPNQTVLVNLFLELGVPAEVANLLLVATLRPDTWIAAFSTDDPLRAVCDANLFQDVFSIVPNTTIDVSSLESLEEVICSLNLTSVDAALNEVFLSDRLFLEVLQVLSQSGVALDVETAYNLSLQITPLISSFIENPADISTSLPSLLELIQQFDIPGLDQTWVDQWVGQIELVEYINDIIINLLLSNGSDLIVPTFGELFPDPSVLVELFSQAGIPSNITHIFLGMAAQSDQWTQLWLSPDPLRAVCNSTLFENVFTLPSLPNTTIDLGFIQGLICSANLTYIDAALIALFENDQIIIEVSRLIFNDPTLDWEAALSLSRQLSEMVDNILTTPPVAIPDIKETALAVFQEVEGMLKMFGAWGEVEHYLRYTEVYLQVVAHHLNISNQILFELFDPSVSIDQLLRFAEMTPEQIRTALLGDIVDIFLLADIYYREGNWDELCNYVLEYGSFEPLNATALQAVYCSLDIPQFFEDAQEIYGLDFLRLTELGYVRSEDRNLEGLDVEALFDLAFDVAGMIENLVRLPPVLTGEIDEEFILRLTNFSSAVQSVAVEQVMEYISQLAPFLNADVRQQIEMAFMSSEQLMNWWTTSIPTDVANPVVWLEMVQSALNQSGVWQPILRYLNIADLFIQGQLDSLSPNGYPLPLLLTNETISDQFLKEIYDMAPDYAGALLFSNAVDAYILAGVHLTGQWESTFCSPPSWDDSDSSAYVTGAFNTTALFSYFCNLDPDELFGQISSIFGVDFLALVTEINRPGEDYVITDLYDWQALISSVQSIVDTYKTLFGLAELSGLNVTQMEDSWRKLEEGLKQFNMEVVFAEIELLDRLLEEGGVWTDIKGYMNGLTTIAEWLNMQLDSAAANNMTLLDIVTHHGGAVQSLFSSLGWEAFGELFTSTVNPDKAATLHDHASVETAVCDQASFNDLLTNQQDTTGLQMTLCNQLQAGHPTIADDLITHFSTASLQEQITILLTHNHNQGFPDQDIDMRHTVEEFERLSNSLHQHFLAANGGTMQSMIFSTLEPAMGELVMNTTFMSNGTLIVPSDIVQMLTDFVIPYLSGIPMWNQFIYPIIGRLDLAMRMVDDLYFTLPDREAEIQAILDDEDLVNDAIPVILEEVPSIMLAWNEIMQRPGDTVMLSKLLLELLKGSLSGVSQNPELLQETLAGFNATGQETKVDDLLVSLDRVLETEFGRALVEVFRIRENAERLDIITNFHSEDLPPFDASFIFRAEEFVWKASECANQPWTCSIDLQAPATLDILLKLADAASTLPVGNLTGLADILEIFGPLLDNFLREIENGTSGLEQTLNTAFNILMDIFQSRKLNAGEILSISKLEEALLNRSSIYQFLRDNTGLTDLDLMTLRSGSVNVSVLLELFHHSPEETINLVCHQAVLDDLLVDVDHNLTIKVVKGLCSNNTLIAINFIRSNLDITTLFELVTGDLSETFPEFFMQLLDAFSDLQDVDFTALGEFATEILPDLLENGVTKISDLDGLVKNINLTRAALVSIDEILTAIAPFLQDVYPDFVDVQRLVEQLLDNLYIFELIAKIPDLAVNRILKDESRLEDYLVDELGLSRSTALDISDATLNLEELLLTDVSFLIEQLCDPAFLGNIATFPNGTDVVEVAALMCDLDAGEIATLIEMGLPHVDIDALINVGFLADTFSDSFSISNRTIVEVMQSIESLETVTMALPALAEAFTGLREDPALEKLRDLAELSALTGEEISEVTQEIVCGTSSSRKRRSAEENLERSKRLVLSESETDFCESVFASIQSGIDGRLVWAYLKPIVLGSILYAPDNAPVRSIIERANRTFADIALTQEFAESWLKGGSGLSELLDSSSLEATQALLDNSYIQGYLEDQYGINAADFSQLLGGNLTTFSSAELTTINLLAELVTNVTSCFNLNRFIPFDTEDEMVQHARAIDQSNTLLAAVVFDIPPDATELPAHIKYKIRMDADNTPPTSKQKNRFFARGPMVNFVLDLRYLRGYTVLQDMIEGSIISLQASADVQPPGVLLQLTPFPCYLADQFANIFTLVLPLVMTISFVVLIGTMTHQLVYEKERGIEELLKVMGLTGGVNWWAWFISNALLLALLSLVVVLIMKVASILPLSDWSVLLIFIMDYLFSIIMFCYMASAVFQRATIAALASILVYMIFYIPYLGFFASESLLDVLWKPVIVSFFSPSTFSIGCLLISQFEDIGEGAQWHLIWKNPLGEEITSLAFVLIALAVDGAIYFVLGWYIRTLVPGKYGVPRRWYFPLQASYWCRCVPSMSKKRDMSAYVNSAFDPESGIPLTARGPAIEEEPSGHPLGVAILNLKKVYSSGCKEEKIAVDNLTVNFFEGQVTALLGHNGAGKTTTINILTGLFPATSGKVYLHGLNVADKARVTRENLGVCVQHNALYDDLTVREHMSMAGKVKGLSGEKLEEDMFTLLEDVGLLPHSEKRVKNLSGGMKRKLSVAMAFVGNSKIVILDEPTSGVDPHARRAIWNLIMKHKPGRTIVLCTHFMDEADILGDRIAILDRGHLRCCGSPAFLKAHFSSGYNLRLAKEVPSGASTPASQRKTGGAPPLVGGTAEPNIYNSLSRGSSSSGIATDPGALCDPTQVSEFIQARIPSATLQEDMGSELVYALPTEGGERERFQQLFEELDASLGELHLKSYGVSDTTLKEVFLKVSTNRSVDGASSLTLSPANWSLRRGQEEFTISEGYARDELVRLKGADIMPAGVALRNAWGIFIKRLHFVRRDWRGFIWTIIMPVVMVALAVGFSELNRLNREVELQLTPAMFNNPDSFVFYSHESTNPMGDKLNAALVNPPGLGTTCMADADQRDLYPCTTTNSHLVDHLTGFDLAQLRVVPDGQCNCTSDGVGVECSPLAGGLAPPQWLTDTGVYLQDISEKEDKTQYLKDTQTVYKDSRYGGVSWFDIQGTDQVQTKAWFNNRAHHAMPTFLNVMNNIILRATVSNNPENYGITAYNHPLELSKQDLGIDIYLSAAETFGIVLIILAALALIPAAFSMFLINEHANGSKRLHYISGVSTLTYWLTNLLWDMLNLCIPLCLIMLVLLIFNYHALISATNIGAFVVLVVLYGFAILSQLYIALAFFKNSGSAFIVFFCTILLLAIITNLPNWLLAVGTLSETEKESLTLANQVFLIFTPFCLSSGLLDLIQNQATADIYSAFGVEDGIYLPPFDLLYWKLVALAVQGGLAFLVLLIMDAVFNSGLSSLFDPDVKTPPTTNDEDVMEEKQRVLSGRSAKDLITIANLKKVYRGPMKQKIVAVNDLCLGIPKGECFGLLGVNGAGKTSTFRMITEDLAPTGGVMKKRAKSIGYCPQEDAMYPQLTGEELLYFYARIKGITGEHMDKNVKQISEELGMEQYIKKRIATYSGGMKRSLSVAVALLGRPELILMDEPTTGMDPITKQLVLNSISNVVKDNRSVILTSHSMEECEAVCTRLAIMVNGQFHCMGSPQHVKHRHGNGYSLVIKRQKGAKTNMSVITEFVHRSFQGAELKEHHHNMVRFQLPPNNITVATIFGVMEQEKESLHLEDYSVSQTSLDQIFVNFAKRQTDGLEDDDASTSSVHEVSIINRAFEPDTEIDVGVQTMPIENEDSIATRL